MGFRLLHLPVREVSLRPGGFWQEAYILCKGATESYREQRNCSQRGVSHDVGKYVEQEAVFATVQN